MKGSTIYIRDHVSEIVTREADKNDNWDRDSTHKDHSISGISSTKGGFNSLDLDIEVKIGKKYFLLYGLYTTGDSFGSDSGNIVFIDLFKTREAAEKVRDVLEKTDEYSIDIESSGGKKYKFNVPWIGYFESLDSLEIEEHILRG